MPPSHKFEYLPLVLRDQGPARFPQAPQAENPLTQANKDDRKTHSGGLSTNVASVTSTWKSKQAAREQQGLPSISGIPLLLKVDTSLDLDDLRKQFVFEIVCEEEDGFVIVASDDIDLTMFQRKLTEFIAGATGSTNVARIHELREDLTQEERLRLILSDLLFSEWPTLADDSVNICDISISCIGNWTVPGPYKPRSNWGEEANERHRQTRLREISEAHEKWDELQTERSDAARQLIRFYGGEVINEYHGKPERERSIPDYFTLRVKLSGRGLRDFVLNYPYIFEVVEPDNIETPQQVARELKAIQSALTVLPPPESAPAVCVIDSGIQEQHFLLEPGIDKAASHCFLPDVSNTDVADYVRPGGHGTRVAGAVLHGELTPKSGKVRLETWIQNARVLDKNCGMPLTAFPPSVLREVVKRFNEGQRKTRIFNQSINADSPCRTRHMSAWGAEIDLLCNDYDILIIQSAGNLKPSRPAPHSGVADLLAAGKPYPDYLSEPVCRVANPGQSLQALTVGSVAYGAFEHEDWKSVATEDGQPSAFSRVGLGIWDSIKPEVVEYGGDFLVSSNNPADVDVPMLGRDRYPELVRSTMHGGPAFDRDEVGTSFAAPKVTRIAARLQSILPDESCLLYRALIVQSARWPAWASQLTPDEQANVLRRLGFGIPDMERATTNTDFRTTLITHEEQSLGPGDCHVYQVPVPAKLRSPADDFDIRIEVTLSYAAAPRRTRRTRQGYLATWLDWINSGRGEPFSDFCDRAVKRDAAPPASPGGLGWTIESRGNWGAIPDIRRNVGTVQKDWTIIRSNALPVDFCIAVRGHQGWSTDPEAVARYTLVVTFEIVGQEIPIYEPLRTAVLDLQAEVEAEIEMEVRE
ncbi:MAG: S8 family peptidase [Planctomycetaceae bacterium]